VLVLALVAAGCKSDPEPFELKFEATSQGARVDCATPVSGLGTDGTVSVGLSDVRFYVSGLEFLDADGEPVETTFDENEFQYQGDSDRVALIDLTGNSTGSCASSAITYSEGTERTNDVVAGTTLVGDVDTVRFDVGVSQPLMQEIIAANTVESAPSPLDEMYWSWGMGYRHFVFNMTIDDAKGSGEGYLHLGSTDCGGKGENALESQDRCDFVNTPAVELQGFDLESDVVAVDLSKALGNLDFVVELYDHHSQKPLGDAVGVECHSFPMQPDCATIFENFGMDIETGESSIASETVFGIGS
jgi:uncharacterized repeat protein (TIGR04052 family)